jgi:hypothetical protein
LEEAGENGDNNESEIIVPAGSSSFDSCCIEGDNDGKFNRPEGIDVGPDKSDSSRYRKQSYTNF